MAGYDLSRFQGIFPAGMTFFDEQGNLDETATRTHWRWLVEQGIDGLVVAGTSGEFIALTMDERARLFRWAVEEFGGKIPIIASTGHFATKWTVEMSQRAQDAGADALIVILPYYSRPPVSFVLEHYRTVRRHTDRPIMLYNNLIYRAILEFWGRHGGFSRAPFLPLSKDQKAELAKRLDVSGWSRPG